MLPRVLTPPPGWGDDGLTAYLQMAFENRWATFAHYPTAVADMSRCDAVLAKLDGWTDPPNGVTPHLGFRAHAAFRVTCEHALAGQLGDMFPSLRACLEAAAYAVHLHASEDLTEAWLRRHENADAMKRLRGPDFQHRAVVESLTKQDADIGSLFAELYQQAIDFGGHPNERGLSVNATVRKRGGAKHFDQLYLHGGGPALHFALHSAVEAGAAAVAILRLIYSERLGKESPQDLAFRAALKRGRVSFGN
jgi:hypothetical protein